MNSPVKGLGRIARMAAVLALVIGGLTACFSSPLDGLLEGAVKAGIDSAVENAGGDLLDGVVGDLSGADGAAELPEGFPSEVPLTSGELEYAGKVYDDPNTIWEVHFRSGGEVDAVGAGIRQQLADAGYTELSWNDGVTVPGMISGMVQNDSLMVSVTVHNDARDAYVKYGVIRDGQH